MVGVEQLIASDIERGRFCGDGSCWHDDDLYIMSRMLRFTGVKTYTARIQRERLTTRTAHLPQRSKPAANGYAQGRIKEKF